VSWKTVALGELCEVLDSKRKPITKRDRTEGSYPYYGATGIVDYISDYIFNEKLVLIGEDGAKWDGGQKTAFIADGKYWVNNHAHVIKPIRTLLLDEWLVYYFLFKDLKEFVTGLTVPKLNQGQLKTIPIPLPPLATQQKIVEKLDAIFTDIDKATVATGKNVKNSELYFSYFLDELIDSFQSKTVKKIEDVCDLYQGLAINKKTSHLLVEKSNLPLLRIKDLKNRTVEQYVAESGFPKNSLVHENEIIYTRTGSLGLVFTGRRGVLHNNSFKVVPKEGIDNRFLFWWLQSSKFKTKIMSLAIKAAQPDISHKAFKEQEIFIPSLKEQKMFSIKAEMALSISDSLKTTYQNKYKELINLKQAILKQAFNGELVKAA
jgi:type I restriction enzyme S subunit